MNSPETVAKLREMFASEPLTMLAVSAAMVAMATTPLAFIVLGRMEWFKARRGRVMQRPEFASIVAGMMLVMGIPAIFTALVVKSHSYDKDRYEFDPNRTWSVLEQGRGLRDLREADQALKREEKRLAEIRKNLVDNVKKLDDSMLRLRAVAGTSPAVAQAIPAVLERLAGVRKSVGVDAPQQLMDFTAPPVDIAAAVRQPAPALATTAVPTAPAAPPAPAGGGLSKAEAEAEIAAVPEPQKKLATMLPLTDVPSGWAVGKSGERHLETFNAENLFEKIDGRAESFIQYGVKGMAYTYYHPTGDPSNEVQVYVFEMGDALKALGKYGSEKPDDVKTQPIGAEGYTSAGSTLFYAGPYYTQIVSTVNDPKFEAFALELAKTIAAAQKPKSGGGDEKRPGKLEATPETMFSLLPAESGKSGPKYVPEDVFGYSFLSNVFMADYKEGDVTWQGFLRPYKDAAEARAIFDKYVENAKTDGAEVKTLEAEGADRMVVSSNIGLVDVVFLKGNVVAGANGATVGKPAEAFARHFAKSLPVDVPMIDAEKK